MAAGDELMPEPTFAAVYLDHDGTLVRAAATACRERDEELAARLGLAAFVFTDEVRMAYFWRAAERPGLWPVQDLPTERAFWTMVFQLLLEDHGVAGDLPALASDLERRYRFSLLKEPYPETKPFLEGLRSRGLRLGVISDTFPLARRVAPGDGPGRLPRVVDVQRPGWRG